MIIAIEGASAAGTTTWCRRHCSHPWVQETPPDIVAPDLFGDPAEIGRFWVANAVANWRRALEIEREHGIAICDGDPLHLYFAWALWQAGILGRDLFDIESEHYRDALDQRRIGLVDFVVWLEAPADELRRRAAADSTRRRKRHEMLLTLVPWMKAWFAARERLLPGTVRPGKTDLCLPAVSSAPADHRYDLSRFSRMIAALPSTVPS
jgi:hypothetical protein